MNNKGNQRSSYINIENDSNDATMGSAKENRVYLFSEDYMTMDNNDSEESNIDDTFDEVKELALPDVEDDSSDDGSESSSSSSLSIDTVNFESYLMYASDNDDDDDDDDDDDSIDRKEDDFPTTNAGDVAKDIDAFDAQTLRLNAHIILNQCGSVLCRHERLLEGNKMQKNFLQRIVARSSGKSIPLLYPEGMLFPGTFYQSMKYDCAICGALPSSLLSRDPSLKGFASLHEHASMRLTTESSNTGKSTPYVSYMYDTVTNFCAAKSDVRIVLNRGLSTNKTNGLSVCGTSNSLFIESNSTNQTVRNLCASAKYIEMDLFLTFTCNQKEHFGLSFLRDWIDSEEWTNNMSYYESLHMIAQEEVKEAFQAAACGLLARNWMKVRSLLINYLLNSFSSPFGKGLAIFAVDENQEMHGNLSHMHLLLALSEGSLSKEEMDRLLSLVRASVCEIVQADEVQDFINEGIYERIEDVEETQKLATEILSHLQCCKRCQVKIAAGDSPQCVRCRKIDNLNVSEDNTKHTFQQLPVKFSTETRSILENAGIIEPSVRDSLGRLLPIVSKHPLFHQTRHIPPTVRTHDMNISPVVGKLFAATKSMLNVQVLGQTRGLFQYLCKYLGKVDMNNLVVVSTNKYKAGGFATKHELLHNTKVASSKIIEAKEIDAKRNKLHPRGRLISICEMFQKILGDPEVYTNMKFVQISTLPYEFRATVVLSEEAVTRRKDELFGKEQLLADPPSVAVRKRFDLPVWRMHREVEILILRSVVGCNLHVDKVTQFSLRPPELRSIFNNIGQYFRWFSCSQVRLSYNQMVEALNRDILKSQWIDAFGCPVRVRFNALKEIVKYFDTTLEIEEDNEHADELQSMVNFFRSTYTLLRRKKELCEVFVSSEQERYGLLISHFVIDMYGEDSSLLLPIPVFSSIRPRTYHHFAWHMLLSFGCFETELDIRMCSSIRNAFMYCKLIGTKTDNESLEKYLNQLVCRYFNDEVAYSPYSQRIKDKVIIEAYGVLRSIIMHDALPNSDMPCVLQSDLEQSIEKRVTEYALNFKRSIIRSIMKDLEDFVSHYKIPSETDMLKASKDQVVKWNVADVFKKTSNQSKASYEEQRLAISLLKYTVDSYINVFANENKYTKSVIVCGVAGSGKSFLVELIVCYAISRGLNVGVTALMAKRAQALGGLHIHQMFKFNKGNMALSKKQAELAIQRLLRSPVKYAFLQKLDILIVDELGQVSAELLSMIDTVLRTVRNRSSPFGGVILIGTMDHTQLSTVSGRHVLLSTLMFTCFSMVVLNCSVRANNDDSFQRWQHIVRMHPSQYTFELLTEAKTLASQIFTYVSDWNEVDTNTIQLFSKKKPAREATKDFIDHIKSSLNSNFIQERICEDYERTRASIGVEWSQASESTSTELDNKVKEPRSLLFFRGGKYEFTFNDPNRNFSQAQLCLLVDLPTEEQVSNFHNIQVLAAPPGIHDVSFDEKKSKKEYFDEGWTEQSIGSCPMHIQSLRDQRIQAHRYQYGLKHHITSTIHASMGDTLFRVALQITSTDCHLWDKGQVVVATSRTRRASDTIFVGDKEETIEALINVMCLKNQYTDYLEAIMKAMTSNSVDTQTFYQPEFFPYCTQYLPLPQGSPEYVYMLRSVKMPSSYYVGETKNLRKRLSQHNSGFGSKITSSPLSRPWAVWAYVCGFNGDEDKELRQYVEYKWKEKIHYLTEQQGCNCPFKLGLSVHNIIDTINKSKMHFTNLKLILLFSKAL